MAYQIVVPELSESVVEATVSDWLVGEGEMVEAGDVVVVLETDKVSLEVTADESGVLSKIERGVDEDVTPGEVLGIIGEGDIQPAKPKTEPTTAAEPTQSATSTVPVSAPEGAKVTPVAARMAAAHDVDLGKVPAAGKITKADVETYITNGQASPSKPAKPAAVVPNKPQSITVDDPRIERKKMSRRRRTIAARLIEAQETAAMLTTFNEIDMGAVMEVRKRRKEAFKEKHGVSLGFSSFFVKAAIGALKAFPLVNAEIDGNDLLIKQFYDIGIAIGAEEGLIVPVLRDADRMSFAEIEQQIRVYAAQSQDGSLPIEALLGGTFTITNGGVFGSMMSTPILNTPQVGILGLHAIKERPVVIDGEIVARPMMYVALTYDHRIVDGREAVQFLVRVKELIEDPETLLIEG